MPPPLPIKNLFAGALIAQPTYGVGSNVLYTNDKYTINEAIDLKHLEKLVYLSNNILQLNNIPYKEVICKNSKGFVILYESTSDKSITELDPSYNYIYVLAEDCCLEGFLIKANDMQYCNEVFKKMKEQIKKEMELKNINATKRKEAEAKAMAEANQVSSSPASWTAS